MHELSLCQDIIDQLIGLTQRHRAVSVARVEVEVGLLSGVEPELLQQAFQFAQGGTVAANAVLSLEVVRPLVECASCGANSETPVNDLRCPVCGSAETSLVRGRELILARVELVPGVAAVDAVTRI